LSGLYIESRKIELPEIQPEERTPLVEALLGIIRQLADRVTERETATQALRDENALRKGQKPRPKMSPSILETPPQPKDGTRPRRRGQPTRPRTAELTIHDTVPLHPTDLPAGATFQGFEAYVVQDLPIERVHSKYERARYELPEGGSVLP